MDDFDDFDFDDDPGDFVTGFESSSLTELQELLESLPPDPLLRPFEIQDILECECGPKSVAMSLVVLMGFTDPIWIFNAWLSDQERFLFHKRNSDSGKLSGPLIHIDESHFKGFPDLPEVEESDIEDEGDPNWEYQPLTEQQIADELKALGWYKEPPVPSSLVTPPAVLTPGPPVQQKVKVQRPKTSKQKLSSLISDPKSLLSESQVRERVHRICLLRLKLSQFIRQKTDCRSKKPPDPKSSVNFSLKPPRPPRPPDPPLSSDNTLSLVSVSSSTSSSNLENQPNTYLTPLKLNSGAENMDEVLFLLFFLTWWTFLAYSYPDRSWTLWKQELANNPSPLLHFYTQPPPCPVVCT